MITNEAHGHKMNALPAANGWVGRSTTFRRTGGYFPFVALLLSIAVFALLFPAVAVPAARVVVTLLGAGLSVLFLVSGVLVLFSEEHHPRRERLSGAENSLIGAIIALAMVLIWVPV